VVRPSDSSAFEADTQANVIATTVVRPKPVFRDGILVPNIPAALDCPTSTFEARPYSLARRGRILVAYMCMITPVLDVDDVRARLAEHRDVLNRYGVERLAVFGSVARGHPSAHSDVDLLVVFARPIGAFAVIRLERELSAILGRSVDLVTNAALKPRLRDRIVAEAVDAA
jgi:predicted nucleotidyltransferase